MSSANEIPNDDMTDREAAAFRRAILRPPAVCPLCDGSGVRMATLNELGWHLQGVYPDQLIYANSSGELLAIPGAKYAYKMIRCSCEVGLPKYKKAGDNNDAEKNPS